MDVKELREALGGDLRLLEDLVIYEDYSLEETIWNKYGLKIKRVDDYIEIGDDAYIVFSVSKDEIPNITGDNVEYFEIPGVYDSWNGSQYEIEDLYKVESATKVVKYWKKIE